MTALSTETAAETAVETAAETAAETAVPAEPGVLTDVPGWFWDLDRHAFEWFLDRQQRTGETGDLLELGAYLGRSAIVMGRHLGEDETFTVCDLFDSEAPDAENSAEMVMSYRKTLTRQAFEANYLAFHEELPTIIQAPTSVLADGRIPEGSCRFVHVDASHLYEHVAGDVQVARAALGPQGVLVMDDYRSAHTPGVAAATWEAVLNFDLRPICLTECKFYATWGDPEPFQDELLRTSGGAPGCRVGTDTIAGHRVLRLGGQPDPITDFPVSRHHDRIAQEARRRAAEQAAEELAARRALAAAARRPAAVARRAAADLVPPLLSAAVRRARRGR
ncbi:class I SAM-dependent methyltransferase [Kitasatospora sp. McL0602]|uniref:class I SAM-dependent methyltransferase n=1 Tax=Kitasatospora sp. McL0602 TaxID=3439530 RepID=UPI003F8953EF